MKGLEPFIDKLAALATLFSARSQGGFTTKVNALVSPRWRWRAYVLRNVVERFFGRRKRFRRVGTRYDKTAASFQAFVGLGAAFVERTAWR